MNKSFRFTNKKTLAGSLIGINVTLLLLGVSLIPRGAHGEFDLNALNAQVQNHEARITNTEKDVTKLQADTGSTPAEDRVAVWANTPPTGQTPAAATTAAPTPPAATTLAVPTVPVVRSSVFIPANCKQSSYAGMYENTYSDGHKDYTAEPLKPVSNDTVIICNDPIKN